MAFPGTFNINYYKGDTYEFNVYPKTTSGLPFDMSTYTTSRFTISPVRGTDSYVSEGLSATLSLSNSLNRRTVTVTASGDGGVLNARVGMLLVKTGGTGSFGANPRIISISGQVITVSVDHATAGEITFAIDERYEAFSTISEDDKFVQCAIQPSVAAFLDARKQYVYDVQIEKAESPYDKIFTLLTGSISITEEVAIAEPVVVTIPTVIPGNVTGLVASESDSIGTYTIDWTAPSGDAPTSYKVYFKTGSDAYALLSTVTAPTTIYTASTLVGTNRLVGGTVYDFKVTSINEIGESTGATVSLTAKTASGPVTGFNLIESAPNTISGSWTAPATGVPATGYNLYGKIVGLSEYVLLTPTPSPLTYFVASEFGGTPLAPGFTYGIKVTSVNAAGENVVAFAEDTVTLDGVTDES